MIGGPAGEGGREGGGETHLNLMRVANARACQYVAAAPDANSARLLAQITQTNQHESRVRVNPPCSRWPSSSR